MLTLLLWDVDGTMLRSGPDSDLGDFHQAISQVSGETDLAFPEMIDGSTDYAVLHSIMNRSGFTAAERDRLFIPALAQLEALTTGEEEIRRSRQPIEGIGEALRKNAEMGRIQTYCTGNSPARAQAKMAAFGLDGFLSANLGGFGSTTPRRADFVAAAIAKTEHYFQERVLPLVIGDTPADIASAQDSRARSVAISAGRYDHDQLAECQPNLIVEDWTGSDLEDYLLSVESSLKNPALIDLLS